MLTLTIPAGDDYIQIGDNIKIYSRNISQIRIAIDAPKDIRIIRSNANKKFLENKDKEL